jgi:hypothetical protein
MISLNQNSRTNGLLLLLLFISAAIFADASNVSLPPSYRTPLSDMVYDSNSEWRAPPEDKNPWRGGQDELIIKPRFKTEFFPKYNYDSEENSNPNSLFQGGTQQEKPVTNIFKYTF